MSDGRMDQDIDRQIDAASAMSACCVLSQKRKQSINWSIFIPTFWAHPLRPEIGHSGGPEGNAANREQNNQESALVVQHLG